MKTTHTPGPWHCKIAKLDEQWNGYPGLVFGRTRDDGTDYAAIAKCSNREDARLIAAAPELLAALESVIHDLENGTCGRWIGDGSASLRAALAKASHE